MGKNKIEGVLLANSQTVHYTKEESPSIPYSDGTESRDSMTDGGDYISVASATFQVNDLEEESDIPKFYIIPSTNYLAAEHKDEAVLYSPGQIKSVLLQLKQNEDEDEMQQKVTPGKPYSCAQCGQGFQRMTKLREHVKGTHEGIKPFKCPYEGCKWSFPANYKLQRHMECHRKKENGVKEFQCKLCASKFTTVYNMNTHMRMHHLSPKQNECTICNETFRTTRELTKHMHTHGQNAKQFKCIYDDCDRRFITLQGLNHHMRSHAQCHMYRCQICNKIFDLPCKLRSHERIHDQNRSFHCQTCSASFLTASHLARHQRSHGNERRYICPHCQKGFLRSDHLKIHINSHVKDASSWHTPIVSPKEEIQLSSSQASSSLNISFTEQGGFEQQEAEVTGMMMDDLQNVLGDSGGIPLPFNEEGVLVEDDDMFFHNNLFQVSTINMNDLSEA